MTAVAGDPMADTLETGELFCVDMDHVARALPLVALHWLLGLQIVEPAKPQRVDHPPDGGEGRLEGPGDAAECAALMPEVHGLLQLLRIERPPLVAANTPSIRQRPMARLNESAPATCRRCAG